MSDYLNETFGINSCKSMIFGASIFDTNDHSGYSEGEMAHFRHQRIHTPKSALAFYPELEQVWEDSKDSDEKQMLCGTSLWLNGFGAPYEDSVSPENCNEKVAQFIKNRGYWTTDQILRSRPDHLLETLFGCFKWHGTAERMVPDDKLIDTAVSKIIRKGLVCRSWTQNPVGVRYSISIKGSSKSKYDYVYLLGGSPDMIADDMKRSAANIGDKFLKAKGVLEDQRGKSVPHEILHHSQLTDPKYCWYEYDEKQFGDDFNNHPLTKARRDFMFVTRSIQGIIFIRNFLMYAKKHLKIKTLNEYNGSSTPNKITIDEVLARYQPAYDYCKTLIFMFEDIAEGKFS